MIEFLRDHPRLVGIPITVIYAFFGFGYIYGVHGTGEFSPLQLGLSAGISALVTAALIMRRSRPLFLAITVTISTLLYVPHSLPNASTFAAVVALYAVAMHRSSRAAWFWMLLLTLVSAVGAEFYRPLGLGIFLANLLGYSFYYFAATFVGTSIAKRATYVAALIDLAAQLATERDQQAQHATAQERSRIARASSSPERTTAAATLIGEVGRGAIADMRTVLGLLAEASSSTDKGAPATPGARNPQPGLAELPALIESFRSVGMPVVFSQSGESPPDSLAELTVYRIVQESLTNALRYAVRPSRVLVEFDARSAGIMHITVTDDGLGAKPKPKPQLRGAVVANVGNDRRERTAPAQKTIGRGLAGMAERVRLHGGTVHAGAKIPHGWRVQASVPLSARAVAPAAMRRAPAPRLSAPVAEETHPLLATSATPAIASADSATPDATHGVLP